VKQPRINKQNQHRVRSIVTKEIRYFVEVSRLHMSLRTIIRSLRPDSAMLKVQLVSICRSFLQYKPY
jgi:hypothetical protein